MTVLDDYPIDFSGMETWPTHTPGEAAERFQARRRVITNYNAARPLGTTLLANEQDCLTVAIARLERALSQYGQATVHDKGVDQVNETIRNWQVQSNVGTSSGFPVLRTGEYDVALRGLVTIAYRYRKLLQDTTYAHIVHDLLNQRGPHDPNVEYVRPEMSPVSVLETENHLLMIESSRYLTNQLLTRETVRSEWNNNANRLIDWILERLQRFLKNDFEEYNSRMYQTYSTMALCNLHDFAEDVRVRRAARMVLDYKAAKFAVSSNGLRRSVPFRRLKEFKNSTNLLDNHSDPDTFRFLILTGLSDRFGEQPLPMHAPLWPRDMMQMTAVCTYRVPRLTLDLIMNPQHRRFYQRFRHAGMEAYVGTPAYLISAGGMWMESVHGYDEYTGYKDAGWAMPTTVMPTAAGLNRDDFVRIDGEMDEHSRTNTAVAPQFACGFNPRIPYSYAVNAHGGPALRREGPWVFVDGANHLPRPVDIHIAVYSAACTTDACAQAASGKDPGEIPEWSRWGFFEVAEAGDRTFDQFVAMVLDRNGGRSFSSEGANEYTTVEGLTLGFTPNPAADKYGWGITLPGIPTNIADWPLAAGDIMNSDGHTGLVRIDNPYQPTLPRAGSGRSYVLGRALRARALDPRRGLRAVFPRGQHSVRSFLGAPDKALILDFRDATRPVRMAPHYTLAEFRSLSGMGVGTGIRTQLPEGMTSLRELLTEPGSGPSVAA